MTSAAARPKRGKGSLRFAVQAPPVGSGRRAEKDLEFAMVSNSGVSVGGTDGS
jgi:hypothetical protein